MKKLRIFVLDESPFFLARIRKFIVSLPGIRIVGEGRSPLSALHCIHKIRPDVIVMDLKAHSRFGVDMLRSIGRMTPVPTVILLANGICNRSVGKAWEKADYLLDKLTECHKIPEILSALHHARYCSAV